MSIFNGWDCIRSSTDDMKFSIDFEWAHIFSVSVWWIESSWNNCFVFSVWNFYDMTRWQTLLEFNLDSDKASWLWPVHPFPDQRQQSLIRFHDILGYTCHKLDYKRRDIANRPLDSLWCSRDFASYRCLRSFWNLLWCPWPEQNRLKFQLISYFTLRKTVSLKESQNILKWRKNTWRIPTYKEIIFNGVLYAENCIILTKRWLSSRARK